MKKQAKLAINELIEDKKHYYDLLKFAIERVKELKQNPKLVHDPPQNGGWYHQDENHNFKKSKTLEKEQKPKTFVELSERSSEY